MKTDDAQIAAFRRSLTYPNAIAGDDTRWSLEERLDHYACPAVSVAVIEKGELAWAEGFGRHELGGTSEVGRDTLFSGASISKPITAALALQMVDQNRLTLDDDINQFLKGWRLPDNALTAETPVTLRHLLSHMAGTTVHGFGGMPPGSALPTPLDVLEGRPPALTGPVRVDKRPGSSVRYSGGGTMIVQFLLEELSGLPFADLARSAVLEPLGMERTTFENPLPEALRDDAAVGHENGAPIPGRWVCVPQLGAGGIWTTASDYARFMIACRNAWRGRAPSILTRRLAEQMMTSQGGQFGLGWEIYGEGPHRMFGHGGSNDGYQCEALARLETGDGAVVLTNAESGLILYWEVFAAVALSQGWTDFMPAPRRIKAISAEEMDLYVGAYDIVSGVEMPELRVWEEDGELFTHIAGMRGGPNRTFRDDQGRLFNRSRPSETVVSFGPDGRAEELSLRMFGTCEILRMKRKR